MNKATRKNLISAFITILILAFGLAMFQYMSKQKKSTLDGKINKKERRTVNTNSFTAQKIPNIIEIDGRLRAQERVNITSRVQGIMLPSPRSIRVGKYLRKVIYYTLLTTRKPLSI